MKHDIAKAMIFNGVNEPFSCLKVELPSLKPGEILIKIKYTTICTSDLHTYFGRRKSPCPSVLGHEIIGKIVATGNNVSKDYNNEKLSIGDLVTWAVYSFDDNDPMAKRGIPQKSANLYKYGHEKINDNDVLNGGFATHCHLKQGTAIFKLPKSLNYKEAAPLNCTHATIAGALRLAGDIRGKNVLVFGAGMLGISACAMAKEYGAKYVFVNDTNSDRLKIAKDFGVEKTFNAQISRDETKLLLADYGEIDIIIDSTGVPEVMEKGFEVLGIGGTAIWVGAVYSARKVNINAENIVRKLMTIKGLHNYTPNDLNNAITFLSNCHKSYPFEKLIGIDFKLEDLKAAFNTANSGEYYRVGIKQ